MTRIDIEELHGALRYAIGWAPRMDANEKADLDARLDALVAVVRTQVARALALAELCTVATHYMEGTSTSDELGRATEKSDDAGDAAVAALAPFLAQPERAKDGGA